MAFDESVLENLFISHFEDRGYTHYLGETIQRPDTEVLLTDDLTQFLNRRYGDVGISDKEIRKAISFIHVGDRGPYVNNRETFERIRSGFGIPRDDKKTSLYIELIDFNNPENNIFRIVNQLSIQGANLRRPDAIVYVNGIPLVVLEFKSAINEDATLEDAYKQITVRYARDIPELFHYNAFVVISDGVNSKVGTIFSDYSDFYSWNRSEITGESKKGLDSIETLMDGVFKKEHLLSIIRDFIYFPDQGKEFKVVCRYPQFFGATRILENVKKHLKPEGDGKGGTYFGTTGCGKSFTMLFLTRMLMRSPELRNPTILLITDRNNLDSQLNDLFVNSKNFINDAQVYCMGSRAELKAKLTGRTAGGVFLSTIQKFSEEDMLLSDRSNIIVISDEAHRSQLNLEDADRMVNGERIHKIGFAKILHDALPNATFVGFTGTPIDDTLNVFGDIIDSYTMVESERDKITVTLTYEGRASKITLDPGELQQIEDYYSRCSELGSNINQIERSKKEMSKMEHILGHPGRLDRLAEDFVRHYENLITEGKTVAGKALLVCSTRPIAYNLIQRILKLRPEWGERKVGKVIDPDSDPAEPIEMIRMVATRGKDDPKEMYDYLGDDDFRKTLEVHFKNINSNFRIAVVVDMWLTGFDVPFLDTIYIDKPIQQHSLIQAISRVNRVYEGKERGLIVDYLGIRKELDIALKKYANGYDGNGFKSTEDFLLKTKEILSALDGRFFSFDSSDYYSDDPALQSKCLTRAVEFVQTSKEEEREFVKLVKALMSAYNNCTYSDDLSKQERDRIYFYSAIRSILVKLTIGDAPDATIMNQRVRDLLERAVLSDEVKLIQLTEEELDQQTVDILSTEYLDRLKKIPGLNTKAKLLERLAKILVSKYSRVNKLKSTTFSERLNKLVDLYNHRHDDPLNLSEFVDTMVVFIENIREDIKSGEDLGIDVADKAFYDILVKMTEIYDFEFDAEAMKEIAIRLREVTDKTCSVLDWDTREDVKAQLRWDIVDVLAEFGFPPISYAGVYQHIFDQMERYKKYST